MFKKTQEHFGNLPQFFLLSIKDKIIFILILYKIENLLLFFILYIIWATRHADNFSF